ncbi:MAG: family protein phosphatase [Blastococcus sp.]|nr:family protein phosphatase [Blastococcus sp.]
MLAEAGVFAVADGLGGHPSGDVASQVAVARFQEVLADGPPDGEDPEKVVAGALVAAHEAVVAAAQGDPDRTGMATTGVLAIVRADSAYVGHVGDSRAYLLRGTALAPLTKDLGMGGYLTQALGLDRQVSPDVATVPLEADARLLLCTDGLTNMVADGDIAQLLGGGDAQEACDALVEAALEAGGVDNVTVIVVVG